MFEKNQKYVTKEEEQRLIPALSAENCLDIVCSYSPAVCRTIEKYGDVLLADFLKELAPNTVLSFQKRTDLVEVVYRYAAPLLGESVARKASEDLTGSPVVLTANHHGVDFFAQSVQGSLFFSLHKGNGNASRTTVPIFSCGSVPLDNLTYPLGLLLYHVNAAELNISPKKMPIFSNRFRRSMVSVSGPIEETMVKRAEARVDKMVREKIISHELAPHLRLIFQEDYCSPTVMDLPSYSLQSAVLNNRIWKRLFSKPLAPPEIVYLELEKIVHMLLESDLLNPESLAWCVMFDSELRKAVLRELDRTKLCWNLNQLIQRLKNKKLHSSKKKAPNNCGTILFWGINSSGRRIPLYLEANGKHGEKLRGIDDRNNLWELPYTPQSILDALKKNHLLPSIFTCFLVLSFARGITCVGGYFQCEYLPMMQKGLAKALQTTSGYHDVADLVKRVPTDTYLSGMQAVMIRIKEDTLIPAGPLEIIAGGGLTDEDMQQILSLTVRDAHLASLFETFPDVVPWAKELQDWKKPLAEDCCRILAEKVVIK